MMEGDDERNINQRKEPDKAEIPDLELTMQAMSLMDPGLCRVPGSQVTENTELDFSCCLIMKVDCTGGSPRVLSQQALKQALSKAWKDKFHGISQVSKSVFMAHFKSQEDMVSIYIKQPWVANSENLLVEWFDPNMNATSSSDYKFDSILVTVRAYGIPRNKRSTNLLKNILNQVGEVSDFHILQENNLFAKQDYIWGTTKLMVGKPIKDKAAVSFDDNSTTVAYLHYEKIKRICLFCGIMFHNTQSCNIRNNLILQRQRNRQTSVDIPTQRFGQWVIDDELIPQEVIQNARMGDQTSNQRGSEILQKLRNLFEEDPKGKGKMKETSCNLQSPFVPTPEGINYASFSGLQRGTGSHHALPFEEAQPMDQVTFQRDKAIQQDQSKREKEGVKPVRQENRQELLDLNSQRKLPLTGQSMTEAQNSPEGILNVGTQEFSTNVENLQNIDTAKAKDPMISTSVQPPLQLNRDDPKTGTTSRSNNSKRSAPSSDTLGQPVAKKGSANRNIQGTMTNAISIGSPIQQDAMTKSLPYNPNLNLAQNAELMNMALNKHYAERPSILGAAPPLVGNTRPIFPNVFNHNDNRVRLKPSRWDMAAQGSTHYTPGSATWKRHANASRERSMPIRANYTSPASPCRSDANSGIANSMEHDPWPLHTAAASFSQGTQDSRLGAFSPPQMARDFYEASAAFNGAFSREVQGNVNQDNLAQELVAANTGNQHAEAEAPAFKAPQEP